MNRTHALRLLAHRLNRLSYEPADHACRDGVYQLMEDLKLHLFQHQSFFNYLQVARINDQYCCNSSRKNLRIPMSTLEVVETPSFDRDLPTDYGRKHQMEVGIVGSEALHDALRPYWGHPQV